MSKIIICGLNGSGKTTLGEALSKRIGYLHRDIEMYYFNTSNDNKYSKARSKDDVIKDLENDFNKYENIVFTACKGDYGMLDDLYDFAIYIRLDRDTRLNRVKERTFKQFGNKVLEDSKLYQQEMQFWEMAYNRDET
ncbi:MAG: AAA family ATPase [Clostridia bacterium]|nr:AAA family ATPase [Clostridia bacterium]